MKRQILTTAVSLALCFPAFAELIPQPTNPPVVIVKEYYGTEANDKNYKNPCKGETIRVCYREYQQAQSVGRGLTKITRIGKWCNGRTANIEEQIVNGSIESVIENMRSALHLNADIRVLPVDDVEE